ncbi:MAG: hypothetical protein GY828_03345 [Candidatus Gracilibacteria bacterium]|nr:hypothetical protein [Candidatus Gracilibacteria bacterium]
MAIDKPKYNSGEDKISSPENALDYNNSLSQLSEKDFDELFSYLSDVITGKSKYELSHLKEDLKSFLNTGEISQDLEKASSVSLDELKNTIHSLSTSIRTEINELQHDIFAFISKEGETISTIDTVIKNIFSPARWLRAIQPSKPHHEFDGAILGSLNSVWNIGKNTLGVASDFIKIPFHTFQILTGKAKTNAFDDI